MYLKKVYQYFLMGINRGMKKIIIFLSIVLASLCLSLICGCAKSQNCTVNYVASEGGSINGIVSQTVVEGEDAEQVTAIADTGYEFVKWSDGIETAERTDQNITADKTFTAIFEKKNYTVKYKTDGNGRIAWKQTQTVAYGGNAAAVTAVPNEGYKFVKWSDGVETSERTDKNIIADKTVMAIFEKRNYIVKYETDGNGYIVGQETQLIAYGGNATTVTAVPNEGYKFVKWSDGQITPERQELNVAKNETLKAVFEKIKFTVRYECDEGMFIARTESGKSYAGDFFLFEVAYGENSEKVTVTTWYTEDERYPEFIGWSDGLKSAERQELNVTSNITVKVLLGYVLEYKVDGANGGKIVGDCTQKIQEGADSQPVTAVADDGYVFCGWSDVTADESHQIKNIKKDSEYIAYFEPIIKTFKYNYGIDAPLKQSVTVDRNRLNEVQFEIPQKAGYIFRGWYADENYSCKVVHASGKLMLGCQTVNLDTDTLYAKWEKIGEEIKTYKILMVMVDKIYATLFSSKINENILVNHNMSGIERQICCAIPPKVSQYLNKWFEGKVIFEIDVYFTREVVKKENISKSIDYGNNSYTIFGDNLTEISDIIDEYECSMVTNNLNDYDSVLRPLNVAGEATAKIAALKMENDSVILGYENQKRLEAIINYNGNDILDENGEIDKFYDGIMVLVPYFHEFAHTIEMRYYYNMFPEFSEYKEEVYEYHLFIKKAGIEFFNATRLYLLYQGVVDGETVGIPPSYWEKFYN